MRFIRPCYAPGRPWEASDEIVVAAVCPLYDPDPSLGLGMSMLTLSRAAVAARSMEPLLCPLNILSPAWPLNTLAPLCPFNILPPGRVLLWR